MTDHLPECCESMIPDFHNERWICICAPLRACEQRVHDEWVRDYGGHRAFALGVQAAREAVDRLASDMANWNSAETADATTAFADLSADQWIWAQRGVHRALAAIDALRGDR